MSWRSMNALRERVDAQSGDAERCRRGEMEWLDWLRKWKPALAAQFDAVLAARETERS